MQRELPRNFYIVLFFILLAGNINVYKTLFASQIKITVMEAGKGTAVLVQSPHNKIILINTGSDASILRGLGEHLPPWKRSIDAVILTGAKARFAGGLPEVMQRYRIKNLIRFGGLGSKGTEDAIIAATIAGKNLYKTSAVYGTRSSFLDVSIDVISPETITISHGANSLIISSSTPRGAYTLN